MTGTSRSGEQEPEACEKKPALHCAFCKVGIVDSYFRIGGAVACTNCAERRLALQRPPQGCRVFLRVILFGLLAASVGGVLGAFLLALVKVGNKVSTFLGSYQVTDVTVLNPAVWWCVEFTVPLATGLMVAMVIRRATGGQSRTACQILAVLLTFGATVLCHFPLMLNVAKLMPTRYLLSGGNLAAPLWALLVDTLVMPWVLFFNNPATAFTIFVPSGVALPMVWRLTARDEALVRGPHSVSGDA